jgi:septum formation protein
MTPQIILASGSKQRKMLMDSFAFDYQVIPADIDEKSIRDENLKIRVKKIAAAKARAVAKNHQGIIIAADTFCACNGVVLEKPKTLSEAKEMLKLQSNNYGFCYTGFCYIDTYKNFSVSRVSVTKYIFRSLSDEEINTFVKNNPVLQWSASFSPAYVYQSTFIKKVSGSFTGMLYGLPVEFLAPSFQKSGLKLIK